MPTTKHSAGAKRKSKAARSLFTTQPGRHIYLNGAPFIAITREGDAVPAYVDSMARLISRLLNKSAAAKKIAKAELASKARDAERQASWAKG